MSIIGVISDTHGRIPDKALDIFKGDYDPSRVVGSYGAADGLPHGAVDRIIHAGDIGEDATSTNKVLVALSAISPVSVVKGNCDSEDTTPDGEPILPEMQTIDIDGLKLAFVHDPHGMSKTIKEKGIDCAVAIHGHTHLYGIEQMGSYLKMNPGAIADPRNDEGRRTVGLIYTDGPEILRVEIIRL